MGCPKQTSASSPADCHGNVFGFSGIWELFVKRVVRNVSLAVCLGCLAAVGRVAVGCGPAAEPSGKPTEPAPIDARADPSALFVEEFLKGLVGSEVGRGACAALRVRPSASSLRKAQGQVPQRGGGSSAEQSGGRLDSIESRPAPGLAVRRKGTFGIEHRRSGLLMDSVGPVTARV
ncbi:MAG: hypothetical protein UZ18_ATM001002154, partial [Armatimonadetes bacterium OLB18]